MNLNLATSSSSLFQRIESRFLQQGLMQHLGAQLRRVEPGVCVIALPYAAGVTQHRGGFHGGAMGALADTAGGFSGLTMTEEGMDVTTVEFKINFMAAFQSGELIATGRVLKAGKRIIVVTAEVSHRDANGTETVCALMQQTLMAIPDAKPV